MLEPAVMKAREVPCQQTTMETATSAGERAQKTARPFNPHGSPPIMWGGGEDESALKDIRKQSAAQRVPAQLRSSFQPEPRREATCAERPKEPTQGRVSGTPTIKTRESIMHADGELCGDREDAMRDSRRAKPPDETAAGVRAMLRFDLSNLWNKQSSLRFDLSNLWNTVNRICFASIFLRCRISRVRFVSILTSSGISRFISLRYQKRSQDRSFLAPSFRYRCHYYDKL
jgi:hypothetical protein